MKFAALFLLEKYGEVGVDTEAWNWSTTSWWDPKWGIELTPSGVISMDFIGLPRYLVGE